MPPDRPDPQKKISNDDETELIKKKREKKKMVATKREKLRAGYVVKSAEASYKVIELLGAGGFGDVYKVSCVVDGETQYHAMKTEQAEAVDKRFMRLKMEMMLLTECSAVENKDRRKHFVKMVDRGRTDTFKFVVMSLVGPALSDIRKNVLKRNFTRSTAMKCSKQTLQSMWDLHEVGYIHRDIKPQNFAVGLDDLQHIVYMLDFGISRRFMDQNGDIKTARTNIKFIGTVRYASRNCHLQVEQSRMDDLESWAYMVVDFFEDHSIPWLRVCEKAKVLKMKADFFRFKYPNVFKVLPADFKRVFRYIDGLTYEEDPNYKYMLQCLNRIETEADIDPNQPLDWIGKMKKNLMKEEDEDLDLQKEGSSDGESSDSDDKKKGHHKGEKASKGLSPSNKLLNKQKKAKSAMHAVKKKR